MNRNCCTISPDFSLILIEVVEHFLHFRLATLQILQLDFQPVQLESLLDNLRLDLLLLDFLLLRTRVGEVLLVNGQHLLLVNLNSKSFKMTCYVLNDFAKVGQL